MAGASKLLADMQRAKEQAADKPARGTLTPPEPKPVAAAKARQAPAAEPEAPTVKVSQSFTESAFKALTAGAAEAGADIRGGVPVAAIVRAVVDVWRGDVKLRAEVQKRAREETARLRDRKVRPS